MKSLAYTVIGMIILTHMTSLSILDLVSTEEAVLIIGESLYGK